MFLVYDISSAPACAGGVLDASVAANSLVITGLGAGSYTPTNADPIGNRNILSSLIAPSVTISASNTTICQGSAVTFTPTAVNGGTFPSYKWYVNNILATTTAGAFTTSALANSSVVKCEMTSNQNCASPATVTSNEITIIVAGVSVTPSISIAASVTAICPGASVIFTPTIPSGITDATYNWYVNNVLNTTNNGAFSTTSLINGDVVKCVLTTANTCATATTAASNSIAITVYSALHVATVIASFTNATGISGKFTATSSSPGASPQYQWFKNNVGVGSNTNVYNDASLITGDNIYCTITSDNTCASPIIVNSNVITVTIVANARKREIALLDLSTPNAEGPLNQNLYSAKQILDVAGIPYIVTTSVSVAQNYAMILGSSPVASGIFSSADKTILKNYVTNGGVLFLSRVSDSELYPLFGIASGGASISTRHFLNFNTASNDPCLKWCDDSLEKTISLGSTNYSSVISTRNYVLNGASSLGAYEDGSIAITKKQYGSGYSYAFGIAFKEIVLRNEMNKDYDAQRKYSNFFEPTTDALFLLVRAVYNVHIPNGVWKHTSSKNSKSTVIMTHDMDATSAANLMNSFSDYELSKGIKATYFYTAHYFSDNLAGNFYDPFKTDIVALLNKNHELASHSVAHLIDMDEMPTGSSGNSRSNYNPRSYAAPTASTGASCWGEMEVPLKLFQDDMGIHVRSYRPGYLIIHQDQMKVLNTLGYEFSSSNPSGDVLTNFPYFEHADKSMSGALLNLLEIPMTVSDVFHDWTLDSLSAPKMINIWQTVQLKNHANYAPTIVLLHPTRTWKLLNEKTFIDNLPIGVAFRTIAAYGDFWKKRITTNYTSVINGNDLTITIANASLPLNADFSMIVENGQNLNSITVQDESNNTLAFISANFDNNAKVLYLGSSSRVAQNANAENSEKKTNEFFTQAKPNPFSGKTEIYFYLNQASNVSLDIFNFLGEKIATLANENMDEGAHQQSFDTNGLSNGIYFYKLTVNNKTVVKKIILQQ